MTRSKRLASRRSSLLTAGEEALVEFAIDRM